MWKLSLSLLAFVSRVSSLNILLTNDDSWASANVRATFDALKADGHDVLMLTPHPSPAVQQSGKGGTFVLPTSNITQGGAEFGTVPAAHRSSARMCKTATSFISTQRPPPRTVGREAAFGIDIVAPKKFGSVPIDLVVSGPNEGHNNGPFLFTLSGTIGAAYLAVERGIPAIAFSAGNNTHRSFTTNTGEADDPANLAAKVSPTFVNLPTFGPGINCTAPPFVFTRLTGGATVNQVTIDNTTGFPVVANGVNANINGVRDDPDSYERRLRDCCQHLLVDYDAPERIAVPLQKALKHVVRGNSAY
ncbi:sure-like protein [Epithele typhae]|uniref:sure-like protein n=1 Tax=Epithele typhae TaxID=378194 RepID=UPI00200819EF|nr:sure-like protein [Epithele typhae]KAH9946376.1 sure-like protein [Epithele typhae]